MGFSDFDAGVSMTSNLVMIVMVVLKPDSYHGKSMRGSGVRGGANDNGDKDFSCGIDHYPRNTLIGQGQWESRADQTLRSA